MNKTFNITGTCYPSLHYMMDSRAKLEAVRGMVEGGAYFTINRPRQYGKTTLLFLLKDLLEADDAYLPIRMDLQGVDEKWYASDQVFAQFLVKKLGDALEFVHPELHALLQAQQDEVKEMDGLSTFITRLAHQAPQKLVLLIDEVDASSNYTPFLRFLAMLRNKYLDRMSPQNKTFHSIVLAGVHDIKSLKGKVRTPGDTQYNSPWNIAADFEVEMSFLPHEIASMLADYATSEGVAVDVPLFSEKLYYYTAGYPFLVSKLCKVIAEKLLPPKSERAWTIDDLETAVQWVLDENNTNFDSLIKNLENNLELYELAYRIIVNGVIVPFNPHDRVVGLGRLYGIFRRNGTIKVHNRMYEQILYDYMVARTFREQLVNQTSYLSVSYVQPDGTLDLTGVLIRFQQFMQEQYSNKDQTFLEREWRLVFLAFLNPILNGHGHTFKEVEVSDERRLDVVVTYHQHQYVIELKRWYGEKAHEKGLNQLADYLSRRQVDHGYLLIFEDRKAKTWRSQRLTHQGKDIFAVWV